MTEADNLKNDPRVRQAKELILKAVLEHAQKIKGIRPADPHLQLSYKEALVEFAGYRGVPLWYPYIGSGLGHGPLVELCDGSVKYDCINGIGVHVLGHSHPKLINAHLDAALANTTMQGNLQQNQNALLLSRQLIKLSGKQHCFLTTSGVMANENALKIALQKKTPASRILAFEHCFAGRTWTFAQVTDKPSFRQGLPLNIHVDYIPFFDPAKPEESTKKALAALKAALQRYPKQHALMHFEFVQGEGGINVGAKSFFEPLMQELKKQEIPILADEVQTFGRTEELFAYHYFGLDRYIDIVTVGKLSQACATLFDKEFMPGPGLLSQTFTASTSMIEASLAILQELTEGGYFGAKGKIARLGAQFTSKMQALEKKHPASVTGPYGLGTLLAFTPYGGDYKKVTDFANRLFEAGVIVFITGQTPTRIRMLLSLATEEKDLNQIISIIEANL